MIYNIAVRINYADAQIAIQGGGQDMFRGGLTLAVYLVQQPVRREADAVFV